ncbi:GNAT family N-acetyltransferase [Pseudotenacibaculum haliotis]|uniref:GNAT family N-acetyltransferase n=1 Tax=Pseudotenacibaculum haliotis TaxID=1862138 RepID=A0ABW5LT17_9FLAO
MDIIIADKTHHIYADIICKTIEESANVRGTGIARRTPEYIIQRMNNGNAVIALEGNDFVGFCYIEKWDHGKFVANSGLIVHPNYRGKGVAKMIKKKIFEHSRSKFPNAKVFSITTGLPVMKMNSDLGYKPVTFSELTKDQSFWKGCQTCKNYDVLQRTSQTMCLCTGMLYDPKTKNNQDKKKIKVKVFQRLKRIKQSIFLKKTQK